MARILIIEDETAIAELEKDYLELSDFEVVLEHDGSGGAARALDEDFDLIILDLMLPGMNGFDICKLIRETKNTPIIMVSAKSEDIDKIRGLGLGADDYMTKPFGVMELVSRVKALLRRVGDQDSEKIMQIGDLVIDDEKRKVFVSGQLVELTYKEYELLHYLAQNKEIVLPRDSIMEHIWHANCEIESRTLDVHIKTLRHKLGDAGKYIKTVRNVGYCMNLV